MRTDEVYKEYSFNPAWYIADYYGYESQSRQLMEEMSELQIAILKLIRFNAQIKKDFEDKKPLGENLIEELADVKICLDQIIYLIGDDKIAEKMRAKINRQLKRIKLQEEDENGN